MHTLRTSKNGETEKSQLFQEEEEEEEGEDTTK